MHTARLNHTATLLRDGTVLVVGGEVLATREMLADVELYDPAKETWTTLAPLPAPRSNHVAILLQDGKVLIAGGGKSAPIGQPSGDEVTGECLLFDPATRQFTATGPLHDPRSNFGAVRLPSGDVLVAGGGAGTHDDQAMCNGVPNCGPLADTLASAETFNEASGAWKVVGSLAQARFSFTLTALASGHAAAVGGVNDQIQGRQTVELYDPMTEAWSAGPELLDNPREHHVATLLGSGGLLIAGGKNPNVTPLASAALWPEGAAAWSRVASFDTVRTSLTLTTLRSGHGIAVGGFDQLTEAVLAETLLFEEKSAKWQSIGALKSARGGHTTTLLSDGGLLVAGGFTSTGVESASCERSVTAP